MSTDDYSADTLTTGSLAVGGLVMGAIETSGDVDWFQITLTAGVGYQIDLEGAPTTQGTLSDPYFQGLYDSTGTLISGTADNDSGVGFNARVLFSPSVSGIYYLAAAGTGLGTYRLSATEVMDPNDLPDETATTGSVAVGDTATGTLGLPNDVDWFQATLTRGATYRIDLKGTSSDVQWTLRDPRLAGLYDSTGTLLANTGDNDSGTGTDASVVFTPLASGTYYLAAGGNAGSFGTYQLSLAQIDDYAAASSTSGSVAVNSFATGDLESPGDTDWFQVTLSAGVEYQIDLEGSYTDRGTLPDPNFLGVYDSTGTPIADTANDDIDTDAGNYNSQVVFTPSVSGTYYLAAGGYATDVGTYRLSVTGHADDFPADTSTTGSIAAGGTATGVIETANDVDWFQATLAADAGVTGYRIDLEGAPTGPGTLADPYFYGIYDSTGTPIPDTADDNSGVNGNARLVFAPSAAGTYYLAAGGAGSTVGTYRLSMVALWSATGTAGDDTLNGDVVHAGSYDTLSGLDGNDVLNGLAGDDTLLGGNGHDWLDGGADVDTLTGGGGNDTYGVDNIGDVVVENAGQGTDLVQSWVNHTLDANLENLQLLGTGPLNGAGNGLANILYASGGNNVLDGDAGTDTASYQYGATASVTASLAVTTAQATGGSGSDTLLSIENLIGSTYNDVLTGNAAANRLNGGAGADTLAGGDGDDTYLVDDAGDSVVENSGEGTDIVQSAVSHTLAANVENLALTGTAALNGTGNTLANTLQGNGAANRLTGGAGADTLKGGGGNDTLYGGTGADTLNGGTGNDTYGVDNLGDSVVESAGQGIDIVQSAVSHTLAANVENLTLTGTAALNGTGNALNNTLQGNGATNVLNGGAGADTLKSWGGNDTLYGGTGADTLIGGTGNDTYGVDNAGDSVVENAGTGIDTVQSSVSYTLAANVENLRLLGTANLNGTGNGLANVLNGGAGANTLKGGGGNDTLKGGAGADTLNGGTGNDTYGVDNAGDSVVENAGAGIDTVQSAVSYTLAANIENLQLLGAAALNGTGNNLANTLQGNGAANRLNGGAGADTLKGGGGNDALYGGAGADTLTGGTGNDTYRVDNAGDVVVESAGQGTDTVQSWVNYTLGANLENLRLLGTAPLNGTGNGLANVLYANSGNNILKGGTGADTVSYQYGATAGVTASLAVTTAQATGGSGSDTLLSIENLTGSAYKDALTGNAAANALDGGVGADTLIGRDGNDTYLVDNAGDVVTETNASATQIDTVQSSLANYTLGANVENLRLLGTANLNGTGNGLANVLYANSGNNILKGGTGADTVSYQYGATAGVTASLAVTTAQATGGSGSDTLLSIENLTGSAYKDALTGNAAANALDGGVGADTLIGRDGNDTYLVDNAGDVVTETNASATQIDTVQSSLANYTLGANVENLRLLGTANLNGTGNGLINTLAGNGGNNLLNGGLGADTLRGGAGNDTLYGGTGADTLTGGTGNDTYGVDNAGDSVVESAGQGTDTVQSSVSHTLAANVENLTLTGTAALNGTGNGFANTLQGNGAVNVLNGGFGSDTLKGWGGSDTLNGGAGADTLYGGLGNDTYILDNASDTVLENASAGIDTVQSAVTYTLAANVENLALTGTAALNGTGNVLANTLAGNGGNNALNGGAGADTLKGWGGNDTLKGWGGNDTLNGGAGADTLTGGLGADTFVFNSKTGADGVTDFVSGTDKLRFSQAALPIGDGDTVLEGGVTLASPGGFLKTAELVIATKNIAGGITSSSAAAAIGSATAAYAVGTHALFAVDNGSQSAVYYFTAANANAAVETNELVLLATLSSTASTALADYGLMA
jgi:Ca2+-binding RTX toxin-like protein